MPRSRATEMPQRPSPRAPAGIRTSSSSDSDPIHHRSRLPDGRSPRRVQSDHPVNQKKLGNRIADLESQLGQAQVELKCLKDQLVSAEAAKIVAQEQLEKKSRKAKKAAHPVEIQEKLNKKDSSDECETTISDDIHKATDVFEVPVEKATEVDSRGDQDGVDEMALKKDEVKSLKSRLDEMEKEVEVFRQENTEIKVQLHEKSLKISSAESEIEQLGSRLSKADQELAKSKSEALQMKEKLQATEKAKEELEIEMKRLRVQTEQWRKAADAAATVLAGEVEANGRRISERCGSMDKHYGNAFQHVGGGYVGYVGSPGMMDDSDDGFGGGKRKGSGIKMFGDLWRKKGHK